MNRRRIDRFVDEALESFSDWLTTNDWLGKERDCINLFAHKFLFEKIHPEAAIFCPTQICIECALKQPARYSNHSAPKDLVIWESPLQTTWSESWEAIKSPKAVLEWKVYRDRFPSQIFDEHDEEWISSYTAENPERFGFVVSVDMTERSRRQVFWKMAKAGSFGELKKH